MIFSPAVRMSIRQTVALKRNLTERNVLLHSTTYTQGLSPSTDIQKHLVAYGRLCAEKLLGKRGGGATLYTRPRQQWLSAII